MNNPIAIKCDNTTALTPNDHVKAINQQYAKSLAEYDENAKKHPNSIEPKERYIAGLDKWLEKVIVNAKHAQAIDARTGTRGVWFQGIYSIIGGARFVPHRGTFILKDTHLYLKLDNPSATFGPKKTRKVTVAPGNMIHTEKTIGYKIQ